MSTSQRRGGSMYSAMSISWIKEMPYEQTITGETSITTNSKKVACQHGNRQKDFIERNKQSVKSVKANSMPKSTLIKRPKEDSSFQNNRQKKNYGVSTSTTHSIYSRSNGSPEIILRDEIKKLKKLLLERDDLLREKESELLDAEDIIDALQERMRQVETRNRELQKENAIMRNYIDEENKKKKSPDLTKIINSMMNGNESGSMERVRNFESHLQKETNYTEENEKRNFHS